MAGFEFHIVHNLDAVGRDLQAFGKRVEGGMRQIGVRADALITARATSVYMRDAGAQAGPRRPGDSGPLRIVSTRLLRGVTGRGREGRIKVTINRARMRLVKTVTVPYAGIHERGGTITIPVTSKMRRFFWAMYFQTSDAKWKAMALSPKHQFTVTIQARPYLAPAMEDSLPAIATFAEGVFVDLLEAPA